MSIVSTPPFRSYIDSSSLAAVGQSATSPPTPAMYKVVTTVSPRNFDLVRSLGASAIFDYHAPDVVAQIKAATGDSLKKALDAAGSGGKVVARAAFYPQSDEPDGCRVAM